MCSHNASAETAMIYCSHIQILILARSHNNTQETCLCKRNKTTNTIILL